MIDLKLTPSEICLLLAITYVNFDYLRTKLGRSPPGEDTNILLGSCHVCEMLLNKLYDTYCREVKPCEASCDDSD